MGDVTTYFPNTVPVQSRQIPGVAKAGLVLSLRILVTGRILQTTLGSIDLLAFASAHRSELWLFPECIGIPHCFALLLIYHFYLNTRKKNAEGSLGNFLFLVPHLITFHWISFPSIALLHHPKYHRAKVNSHSLGLGHLQSEFGIGSSLTYLTGI